MRPNMAAVWQAAFAGAIAAAVFGHSSAAEQKYPPGVSDTEIKIGQTLPYSGPASSFATIGRTQSAYYRMVNEQGGVGGRNITFISLDDGYSPPKTVEQTRRLVEQEGVLGIFGSLGTPTNAAVQRYLNEQKVPQLFLFTGTSRFRDPEHFPWTMGGDLSFVSETRAFARFIEKEAPEAKIAVLYQNDDYGKDHLNTLKVALGSDKSAAKIVAEAAYEATDPTVDSQIVVLKGSGANTLLDVALPKFAAQAIRKVYDTGWKTAAHRSLSRLVDPADLAAGRTGQVGGRDYCRVSQGAGRSRVAERPGRAGLSQISETIQPRRRPERLVQRDRLLHGLRGRGVAEELRRRSVPRACARAGQSHASGNGADAVDRHHPQHHPDRLQRDQTDAAQALRRYALGADRWHRRRISANLQRAGYPAGSAYFTLVGAGRRRRVVAVVPPRRVIEMNHKVTVVRGDGFFEH